MASVPEFRILDAHIHLWPGTSIQPKHFNWMTADHQLAKQQGVEDYLNITQPKPHGFVYVETDRYLPSPIPEIDDTDGQEQVRSKVEKWAEKPLEEIKFLRRIVEQRPEPGDGFRSDDGALLRGGVIWAPFYLPTQLFQTYLSLAEAVAGPALWSRVVGFRLLLQGKAEGEAKKLIESEAWLDNIVSLRNGREGRGWTFDVGIDTHRDGVERLEEAVSMIEEVRRREESDAQSRGRVRFILNHLNKPPLSTSSPPLALLARHKAALARLSHDKNIYIKLSGALNEFSDATPTPDNAADVVCALQPWTDMVFAAFPRRVLFGSDWPVCNVGGPKGEDGNWRFWVEVVERLVKGLELGEEGKERLWCGAAEEAYELEL